MWREGSGQEAKVTPGSTFDRLQIGEDGGPWRININCIDNASSIFGSGRIPQTEVEDIYKANLFESPEAGKGAVRGCEVAHMLNAVNDNAVGS